jgi:hypothetical protein
VRSIRLVVIIGALLCLAAPAAAQTITVVGEEEGRLLGDAELQRLMDECYGDRTAADGLPDCTFSADGELVSRIEASPQNPIAGFVLLAFLWTAIPLGIAAAVASSRGESVGLAVVLTLLLGWIGLAISLVGQRRTIDAASGALRTAMAPEPDRAGTTPVDDRPLTRAEAAAAAASQPLPAPPRSGAATSPLAERLRTLDELRTAGVITDDEHARRREAIIAEV